MKKILFLFVLLVSFQSFAMSVGERRALSVPRAIERNMNTLVQYLTSNISDKKEKVFCEEGFSSIFFGSML